MSFDIKIITKDSPGYPKHLKNIQDPPEKLYCIGNLDLIRTPLIAMVGTRRASPYGKWAAYEIAKKIAACGIPIVSGMASGIDTKSHRGCLDKGTGTVAVLGTGIDVPFPESNRGLYEEIAVKGLILSEYKPGEAGFPQNFPRRNRIISGLSSKVIVVEGAYKSGSMITARLALEQGREVYAVPGNINQPGSMGVNRLIQDGAFPITDMNEVLDTLGISGGQVKMAIANASKEELLMMDLVRHNPGITTDEIAEQTKETASKVLAMAMGLELKGLLRSEGKRLFFT